MQKMVLMDIQGIFVVHGTSYLCKPGIIVFVDVDLKQAGIRLESGLFRGQRTFYHHVANFHSPHLWFWKVVNCTNCIKTEDQMCCI